MRCWRALAKPIRWAAELDGLCCKRSQSEQPALSQLIHAHPAPLQVHSFHLAVQASLLYILQGWQPIA